MKRIDEEQKTKFSEELKALLLQFEEGYKAIQHNAVRPGQYQQQQRQAIFEGLNQMHPIIPALKKAIQQQERLGDEQ